MPPVAQRLEHRSYKSEVTSSNLVRGTTETTKDAEEILAMPVTELMQDLLNGVEGLYSRLLTQTRKLLRIIFLGLSAYAFSFAVMMSCMASHVDPSYSEGPPASEESLAEQMEILMQQMKEQFDLDDL